MIRKNRNSTNLPQTETSELHSLKVFLMQIMAICLVAVTVTKLLKPGGNGLQEDTSHANAFCEIPVSFPAIKLVGVCNDQNQLYDAVNKVRPHWKIPKINNVLHALRLWSNDSKFRDDFNPFSTFTPSGHDLLSIATDNSLADNLGVLPLHPFLYRTRHGISPQFDTGEGGIAHVDQYLKVLGEIGVSANTIITLSDGSKSDVSSVIESSLYNFHLGQELEFTAVAYSRWLPPNKQWRNRYGSVLSFDDLTSAILLRPVGTSSCHGIHSLYALTNIYRAHLEFDILSPNIVRAIESRLQLASALLTRNQSESGLWFGDWATSSVPSSEVAPEHGFEAIMATGHHLEWIALTPKELRPSDDSIRKASRALAAMILKHDALTISNSYAPFSHAARSLLLLNDIEARNVSNGAFVHADFPE